MLHSLFVGIRHIQNQFTPPVSLLGFLLLRDTEASDTALSFRRRVGARHAEGGESIQGYASSWLEADVKTHKSTAHTPQRKLRASGLVSEAKESCYSSLLCGFEISSSSFLLTIITQFTLQSSLNNCANSILGCICLDKWFISSYILAIQHFCLYSKYPSFSQGKQTFGQNQNFPDHLTLASHPPHECPWTCSRSPSGSSTLNLAPPEEDCWGKVLCLEINISRKI